MKRGKTQEQTKIHNSTNQNHSFNFKPPLISPITHFHPLDQLITTKHRKKLKILLPLNIQA